MLKEELSQIISAESAATVFFNQKLTEINIRKETLQKKLYQDFKENKEKLHEEFQQKIEQLNMTIEANFEDELKNYKTLLSEEYTKILSTKSSVIEDLVQYMWCINSKG